MKKSVSPSRTYVAMCSGPNFKGYIFKKFTLPKRDSGSALTNDNAVASWYFLNRLDIEHCIDGSIAFEDFLTVFSCKDNLLRQVLEARDLLKNIKENLTNGQISYAPQDIQDFFDKYPDCEELTRFVRELPVEEVTRED
jgi:hypothetical protein